MSIEACGCAQAGCGLQGDEFPSQDAGQSAAALKKLPENSRPVNLLGINLVEAFGAAKSYLAVSFRVNSSSHDLVHTISKRGKTVTVTIADHLTPSMGMQVIMNKEAQIALPRMGVGTTLVVKNSNGVELLRKAVTLPPY